MEYFIHYQIIVSLSAVSVTRIVLCRQKFQQLNKSAIYRILYLLSFEIPKVKIYMVHRLEKIKPNKNFFFVDTSY